MSSDGREVDLLTSVRYTLNAYLTCFRSKLARSLLGPGGVRCNNTWRCSFGHVGRHLGNVSKCSADACERSLEALAVCFVTLSRCVQRLKNSKDIDLSYSSLRPNLVARFPTFPDSGHRADSTLATDRRLSASNNTYLRPHLTWSG